MARIIFSRNGLSMERGMNEKGLVYDFVALDDSKRLLLDHGKKKYPGPLGEKILAECATAAEAARIHETGEENIRVLSVCLSFTIHAFIPGLHRQVMRASWIAYAGMLIMLGLNLAAMAFFGRLIQFYGFPLLHPASGAAGFIPSRGAIY